VGGFRDKYYIELYDAPDEYVSDKATRSICVYS